jgi:hypothetical protein
LIGYEMVSGPVGFGHGNARSYGNARMSATCGPVDRMVTHAV